jgi:O-antigen/teichoic acid export membrane protein
METLLRITTVRAFWVRYYNTTVRSNFGEKVTETYLTRMLVMGLALVSTVMVSRSLGPEGRGYYAVAMATGALGVQFATLGMHTANAYFVAKRPESLPHLMGNAFVMSIGMGALVVLLLLFALRLRPNLLDIRGATLGIALLWIPIGLTYTLFQSLLLGIHDIRSYNLIEIGNRLVVLLLVGFLVLARRGSVVLFVASALVGLALACGWEGIRLKKSFPGRLQFSFEAFREGTSYAFKAYWAATFCFLVLRADLFMVQHMLGPVQAGYYSIAATMADYVSVLAAVVGSILFPKLSALEDLKRKFDLTKRATMGTAVVLIPFLTLTALLAKPVVKVFFGTAFLPASWCFVLLMPGMLFLGIHAVSVQFLNSIGYPKSVVIIWGLGSLFNIMVNLWAIPRFGIAGASIVSSISYFLVFAFVTSVIYEKGRELIKF